jgi:predicted metal-dependent hydrolase
MDTVLQLGEVAVHVTLKEIKNVHLGVYPPSGRVRIAAPARMKMDAIRSLAISKLAWIRRQQRTFRDQEREAAREYVSGESHHLWGRRYLLSVEEREAPMRVDVRHRRLHLQIRPGTSTDRRAALLDAWYREKIRGALVSLLAKWQKIVGRAPKQVFVRRMRTKWGGCNPGSRNIRLNTELAKKPKECLEYILVHELAHLREPTHNARFSQFMDQVMPGWEIRRRELNRLPLRYEAWTY